jgi:phosphoserine phosphatase RsbU/P
MLGVDLGGRFITIAYMLLTLDDGQVDVSLACAGHPPPILVPASGESTPLPARGTLLGIWPEIHLETARVRLGPGDGVVLYTDGVSDPGPGSHRPPAEALDARPQHASADQLAGTLEAYARQPQEPQRDDIAIVAVRFLDPRRGTDPGAEGSGPRELALSST